MLSGGGCALVYCRSCAEAERVCDGLIDLGLVAAFYHAQVSLGKSETTSVRLAGRPVKCRATFLLF